MHRTPSIFLRAIRLSPIRAAADDFIARLRISAGAVSRTVLLPYSSGLGYFVIPTGGMALAIASEDFRAELMGLLPSLWVRLRLALLFKRKKYLRFEAFSLFSFGVKPERKRFTTFNAHLLNAGLALEGDLIDRHPELLTGWPRMETAGRPAAVTAASNPAAIVAHVFYEDTWADVAEALKRLTIPFDLIVTTVSGRDRLIESVRRDFPDARIEAMENRGRDVRPFLELLEQGRLDRYRYVCKIHGKKSSDGGRMPYLGALWRRRLLFELLAAPGVGRKILERFEGDPAVGMIGPAPSACRAPPSRSNPRGGRRVRKPWSSPRKWAWRPKASGSTSSAERCSGSGPRRCGRCAICASPPPFRRSRACSTAGWST